MKMNPAALGALLNGDLENAIIASTPGGIEAQEARGQRDFVASTTLPKECLNCTRGQLEKMGIVYGDDADDLFINVQLPEGWAKVPTDHSMWSHLVDEQGRKRASIFYKAAFYDRSAHISPERRFNSSVQPETGWDSDWDDETAPRVCVITDCGVEIWRSDPLAPSDEIKSYNLRSHLYPLGAAWLDERYPDWNNPLAYWDEPVETGP